MARSKLFVLAGVVIFPIISFVALYRLMFWFPINIAGHVIGQTASFFIFIIFAALTIICFQNLTKRD